MNLNKKILNPNNHLLVSTGILIASYRVVLCIHLYTCQNNGYNTEYLRANEFLACEISFCNFAFQFNI